MRRDPVQFKISQILDTALTRPPEYLHTVMAVARLDGDKVWLEWDDFVRLKASYDPDWRSRGITFRLGDPAECKTCVEKKH